MILEHYRFQKRFFFILVFSGMVSPANAKLGLRMTTLHEEPTKPLPRKHSFDFCIDDPIEEQVGESNDDEKVESSVSWKC